ncbi:MFS transporter [Amycolatopsis alkalitolerans]|uniref:Putative proline/betaine transporter n=1 Tax=Amycolatopsis alkalitolerans TaxID=2547244 RepID=A0A5C4M5I9_9PSEU|nr:MFS transporter [Amycolatopsis alkalitolerans]TNC25766.1 MHS family MFS transporter [Amycolatopsis alkalitolerans]
MREPLAGQPSQDVPVSKVALASAIGTTIEWYDFFLYGTAASLAFNHLFFPSFSPAAGVIAAFATFAVGYLSRPIGSVVFGHFGDRLGRKKMLVSTLFVMGLATFAIGLLPTYGQIGVWAPILLVLMRALQGIGIGGEYGGAVVMAVEYAPPGRRGFFGSWPQVGVPAGLLLASGVFAALSGLLPKAAFTSYGWRIGFLLSALLVAVGLYVRLKVLETPAFTAMRNRQEEAKLPFAALLRGSTKEFWLSLGTRWVEGLTYNAYSVLVVSFVANQLHLSGGIALTGVIIASALGIVLTPLYGALSDRVGRKTVYTAGVLSVLVLTFPSFWAIQTGQRAWIWLGIVIPFGIGYFAIYAPLSTFWSELFDTRYRYTGVGAVYQFSGVYASGLTPVIGVTLFAADGGRPWYFAAYMVVVAVISLVATAFLPETNRRDIMPGADGRTATRAEGALEPDR